MSTKFDRARAAWEKTLAEAREQFRKEFDPDATGVLLVRGHDGNALFVEAPGPTGPMTFWVPMVQTSDGEIAIGGIDSWRRVRFEFKPVAPSTAAASVETIQVNEDSPGVRVVDAVFDVGARRRQVAVPVKKEPVPDPFRVRS